MSLCGVNMYKYILLIFIIGLNFLNAQTSLSNDYSSANSYSEDGYIRNEEEARYKMMIYIFLLLKLMRL